MLISKKTHCYRCEKGGMVRTDHVTHPASKKIRYAKYTCTSCESFSKVHLKGRKIGMVEYNEKD